MSDEKTLKPRERFIAALERRNLPGRVPHFELVFFLTMEVFGKVHPNHRNYAQWMQMSEHERNLHRDDMARLFVDTAERFEHDAIFVHQQPHSVDEAIHLVNRIREISGDRYFTMIHGDSTLGIPSGSAMQELSCRMVDEPDALEDELARRTDRKIADAEKLKRETDLDGFALCSDYCFNTGPFLPLEWFDRFVTPNLKRLIAAYRELGFYTIKHTDGNIMPILDRLLDCNPHALHSLDPQGGVDMAEMVRRAGDKVCLCGNVNCGLLQTGTDQECIDSACYALEHGKQAPGYVFCTSNCVYTGMGLQRYELIRDVWKNKGYR